MSEIQTPAETTAQPRSAPMRLGSGRALFVLGPAVLALATFAGLGFLAWVAIPDAADGWLSARGVPVGDRQASIALAAAGAACSTLWGFGFRARIRVLHRVRSALMAFGHGERSMSALTIAPGAGIAAAWNAFVTWRGDESERAEAEAVLTRHGAGESSSGESSSDLLWHGVMIIDEQLVVRYANGAAAVFLRAPRETLSGADARSVIKDDRILRAVRHSAESGSRQKQTFDVGNVAEVEAGVLRYSVRASPREGGRRVLVVIEDVTQQRVSEEVQHAFVAQAAHELRTPLTNIRLYLEQLLEEEMSDVERGKALNVINSESGRLERIVSDMLSIAEIQSGRMNVVSGDVRIQQMLTELEADFGPAAERKNISLAFELPPKYPLIRGDRGKLGIVLHNLLGNAVKYTPEGGVIKVVVREEGDRLMMDFVDTGIGISEEDIGRVFERFARAHDSRVEAETGTGLGLAIARDIARLHGGDITVKSVLDEGSTFTFWMPVGAVEAAQAA